MDSLSERIYFVMHPENDGDRQKASDFWRRTLGKNYYRRNDPVFMRGFIEGALEADREP